MWADAQRDGCPAKYIGGALRSTPQTLADAHYCKNHMLVINACDAHHVGEGNTIFWHNYAGM